VVVVVVVVVVAAAAAAAIVDNNDSNDDSAMPICGSCCLPFRKKNSNKSGTWFHVRPARSDMYSD
jgi:CDP-diacylglycerol pyrophosphatase